MIIRFTFGSFLNHYIKMINCMSTFLTALCNQKQEEKQKRKNIWMKIRLHFSKNVFNSFEKQSWKLLKLHFIFKRTNSAFFDVVIACNLRIVFNFLKKLILKRRIWNTFSLSWNMTYFNNQIFCTHWITE